MSCVLCLKHNSFPSKFSKKSFPTKSIFQWCVRHLNPLLGSTSFPQNTVHHSFSAVHLSTVWMCSQFDPSGHTYVVTQSLLTMVTILQYSHTALVTPVTRPHNDKNVSPHCARGLAARRNHRVHSRGCQQCLNIYTIMQDHAIQYKVDTHEQLSVKPPCCRKGKASCDPELWPDPKWVSV